MSVVTVARHWTILSGLLVAIMAGVAIFLPSGDAVKANGAIGCGDTLGPGSHYLTGDVGYCTGGSFGIKLTGERTHLDLNGFKVSCGDPIFVSCILLENCTRCHVNNGSVKGGTTGVELFSGNRNVVNDLYVYGYTQYGIRVLSASDNNKINGNSVNYNVVTTIQVFGIRTEDSSSGNRIGGNVVSGNTTDLIDFNGECVTNKWRGNTFATSIPSCLK